MANVASVHLREMAPGINPTGLEGQNPGYRDLIEFAATYDITFRTESAGDMQTSGPKTRFFVVGRPRTQNTWVILSIGTGP